jgi:aspartate carbamoyltransferase regulatory subunit
MNIDGVNTGIVLDHIQAGKSMQIYALLGLGDLDCCVAVIQNVRSKKHGKKDIIKIDKIIDLDFDALGYIDPNITVNIVREGERVEKKHMALPKRLVNIISCKNPRCITSSDHSIPQRFKLADEGRRIYRCEYCDIAYSEN